MAGGPSILGDPVPPDPPTPNDVDNVVIQAKFAPQGGKKKKRAGGGGAAVLAALAVGAYVLSKR